MGEEMSRGALRVVEGVGRAKLSECVIHVTIFPVLFIPLLLPTPSRNTFTPNPLKNISTLKFGKFFPAALSMNQCTSPFAG